MFFYRWLIAALLAGGLLMTTAIAAEGPPQQIIIKWRDTLPAKQRDSITARSLKDASTPLGISLQYLRTGGTGAEVYKPSRALSRSEMDGLIKRLTADPGVEYVEEDSMMRTMPQR
jgi:serine protease